MAAAAEEVDHSALAAMEVVVGPVEETETTAGVIAGVVVEEEELATIVTRLDTWQEIAPQSAERAVEAVVVDLEAEAVVVVAGLATIATKKGIWQGNVPKVTVEIAEANK